MLRSCAKLSPRYCGLFELLERIGPVAYRLSFLTSTRADNVFHVSLIKKYIHDPNHVRDWDVIYVEPEGEFRIEPMHILNRKVTMLRNWAIGQVKVQWEHHSPEEATWELEDAMRLAHPFLFNSVEHWGRYQCNIFVQFCKALRTMLLKEEGNVCPGFESMVLNCTWCKYFYLIMVWSSRKRPHHRFSVLCFGN